MTDRDISAGRSGRGGGSQASALSVAIALAAVYLVWGSTYVAIRIVVGEMPPLSAMGLRFTGAALVLGVLLVARRGFRVLRLTPRQVLGTAFLSMCIPFLGNGMVSVAISHGATSGLAALLNSIAPLVIVALRFADGDRPHRVTLLGVGLGFGGLAVLLLGRGDGSPTPLGPALLIVFAATCWAIGSFLQPRLWIPRDPFVLAVWEMLGGGLIMLAVGRTFGERLRVGYSGEAWLALAYLVVFGAVLAYTAYIWLLSNAPISVAATYAYVNPVVAVCLGWLLLGEQVTFPIAVGGCIVVTAIALVVSVERRKSPTGPATEPPV